MAKKNKNNKGELFYEGTIDKPSYAYQDLQGEKEKIEWVASCLNEWCSFSEATFWKKDGKIFTFCPKCAYNIEGVDKNSARKSAGMTTLKAV